jgi:hypothetical protein
MPVLKGECFMKKELLVLALCAVLFSGCGAGADSSSEKSVEKVSSVQTTAPQAEKESTARKTTTSSGVTIIDGRDQEDKRKIFDHNDGEYVEFEEV